MRLVSDAGDVIRVRTEIRLTGARHRTTGGTADAGACTGGTRAHLHHTQCCDIIRGILEEYGGHPHYFNHYCTAVLKQNLNLLKCSRGLSTDSNKILLEVTFFFISFLLQY